MAWPRRCGCDRRRHALTFVSRRSSRGAPWRPSIAAAGPFLSKSSPSLLRPAAATATPTATATSTTTTTKMKKDVVRLRNNGPGENEWGLGRKWGATVVACNVYVSAGSESSSSARLLRLLSEAQRHCRERSLQRSPRKVDDEEEEEEMTSTIQEDPERHASTTRSLAGEDDDRRTGTESSTTRSVAVVHAFGDPIYDRSSFHLAGGAALVVPVAARLALRSHQELGTSSSGGGASSSSSSSCHEVETHRHPSVGIVDHVSVMPMSGEGRRSEAQEAAAEAAMEIGRQLEQGLSHLGSVLPRILYYGGADPQGASLADVRRHRTNFFQSSRPSNSSRVHVHVNVHAELTQAAAVASSTPSSTAHNDTRTLTSTVVVGAPERFVENWNVRVSSNCPRHLVTALTRRVRALRGIGGGRWVEALTLPYSHGQWEVACNLLHPQLVSSRHVDECARAWLLELAVAATAETGPPANVPIVKSYRVGTTEKQCWEVLRSVSRSEQDRTRHDECLMEQFRTHLDSS